MPYLTILNTLTIAHIFCFTLKLWVIGLTISHIQRSLTAVSNNGEEGLLQAKPADRDWANWVLQPYKISHLFSILDLQGAYPTQYLLAIFNLFWPGLNLLGRCFLCFLPTFSNSILRWIEDNEGRSRQPAWDGVGQVDIKAMCSFLLLIPFSSGTLTSARLLSTTG